MARWGRVRGRVADARRTGALHVLVATSAAALVLLLAYALHYRGWASFTDDRWDADVDLSLVEVLGYTCLLSAAVLLLVLFLRTSAPVHAAWAAAFSVLAADDALQLHERAGRWLDRSVGALDPPGLRTEDLGELAFWVGAGAVVAAVLYATHGRSADEAQQHSRVFAALLALLAVFAVGIDMLHIVIKSLVESRPLDFALSSVEAAGEVGAMAAVLAYAVHITRGAPDPYPSDSGPAAARRRQEARPH